MPKIFFDSITMLRKIGFMVQKGHEQFGMLIKGGNEDNKLVPFCINYEKLLEKYKVICNKIENLKQ